MTIVSKNEVPGKKPMSDKEMVAEAERALSDIAKVREGVGRMSAQVRVPWRGVRVALK